MGAGEELDAQNVNLRRLPSPRDDGFNIPLVDAELTAIGQSQQQRQRAAVLLRQPPEQLVLLQRLHRIDGAEIEVSHHSLHDLRRLVHAGDDHIFTGHPHRAADLRLAGRANFKAVDGVDELLGDEGVGLHRIAQHHLRRQCRLQVGDAGFELLYVEDIKSGFVLL